MKTLATGSLAIALAVCMATTAFAAGWGRREPGMRIDRDGTVYGYGCSLGYGFMCDEDGNLLTREAFEEKLDGAIADGTLRAEDKEAYLAMYDYCAQYGGMGGSGGCRCGRW